MRPSRVRAAFFAGCSRCFFLAAALTILCSPTRADDAEEFKSLVARASQLSNLTEFGSLPFHLKILAADRHKLHPEFNTYIELWWAAPDKWRRQITSQSFSQRAVQNGTRYYESSSSAYFPWWLHEVTNYLVHPVPVEELADVVPQLTGTPPLRCAEWQTEFTEGVDSIGIHNSLCFNPDGLVQRAFTRTMGVQLGAYVPFGEKRVPGGLLLDTKSADGSYVELVAGVTKLEHLAEKDSFFAVAQDTGLAARTRFVSVPQSALQDYKLEVPPVQWPVVYNFPVTGMMTINVKIDRDGAIREIGSPISRNVLLSAAAVAQVKKWRFRPFLVDGAPVQVNVDLAFRFETHAEMLGSNEAHLPLIPFLTRIQTSRRLSDPRAEGGRPFHLHAIFQYADNSVGSYEEFWQAPTKWKREAVYGDATFTETRKGDLTYQKVSGSSFSLRQMDDFLDEMKGHFPRIDGSFIEADWGQSAVQVHSLNLARVARGQVDAENTPTSGQAYWFDSAGLLQAAFVAPRTSAYSDFTQWNGKLIPGHIAVTDKDVPVLNVTFDHIEESAAPLADSLLALEDVEPQKAFDPDAYQGPVIIPATPTRTVDPIDPHAGHGTVIVEVQLDEHGRVRTVRVSQSAGQALDDAAVEAAKQWEFTPMRIRGQIVAGFTKLEFKF
jgi:TonB family protein